jgi:hypothetical protein
LHEKARLHSAYRAEFARSTIQLALAVFVRDVSLAPASWVWRLLPSTVQIGATE